MKRATARPTFAEGVGVALASALAGAGAFALLSVMMNGIGLFRFVVAMLGFAYVVYLLARSSERTGRTVVIGGWLLIALVNFIVVDSPLLYAGIHVGAIWLVRTLYYYQSVLPAIIDLCLSAIAVGAGLWAAGTTQSLFASFWCFFLVQALFTLIPPSMRRPEGATVSAPSDDFEHAHRNAQTALRKIANIR